MLNHTHMEHNNNNNNDNINDQLLEIQDKFEKGLALVEEPSSSSTQVNWDDDDEDEDEDEDVVFVFDENDNDNDNDDEDEEGSQDGGFEFSFASGEEIKSPVSAEELFLNGKIRPTLPFSVKGTEREASGEEEEHYLPPVKKVFVVSKNESPKEGPYCVWSAAPPENDLATPEMSKKSNSTGFSKLWRMKDLLVRSNSDGKDTFVFLPRKGEQPEKKAVDKKKMKVVSLGRIKVGGGGKKEGETVSSGRPSHTGNKEKKKGKKPSMMAAYEALYGKKKGGVGDKDKSYLPYKVGFFTNSSGMTKNVHPY